MLDFLMVLICIGNRLNSICRWIVLKWIIVIKNLSMLRILCFSSMISSLIYESRIGISIPKKHGYRFISIMISFFNVIILQFHSRVIDIRFKSPFLFHSLWSSIFLILISLRVAKKERSPDRCILIWIESLIHIHMIGKYFRVLMYPSFW